MVFKGFNSTGSMYCCGCCCGCGDKGGLGEFTFDGSFVSSFEESVEDDSVEDESTGCKGELDGKPP